MKFITENKLVLWLIRLWKRYIPIDRILAQRMFKATVNSTLALIFCLIPQIRTRIGTEPVMLPLISVIVHPGRRVSGTIQGAIYCMTGLVFGLAYALFGRFIALECIGPTWRTMAETEQYKHNFKRYEAGLAIMAIFETFMLFFHGWMRSVSHHYFAIVFPLFLVVHFTFLASTTEYYGVIAKTFSTPFYLGIAMSLFWNVVLFPEFGSTYLGNATIDALNEIHKDINQSIKFFISLDVDDFEKSLYNTDIVTLSKLLKYKTLVSKKITNCDLVLQECIYEISYSYVPPYSIQGVLNNYKKLSIYINGVINACQLQFILLGRTRMEPTEYEVDLHNEKEIEFADANKLLMVIDHLRLPIYDLHAQLSKCLYHINLLLAYSYDVKFNRVFKSKCFKEDASIPSVTKKSELPTMEAIDQSLEDMKLEVEKFKRAFQTELVNINNDLLSPNDEMFLFSSFLMNLKEITNETVVLTEISKSIFQDRHRQEDKGWLRGRRVWFTFLKNFKSLRSWYAGNTLNITENDTLKGVVNYNKRVEVVARRPITEEDDLLMQKTTTHRASISTEKNLLPISRKDSAAEKIRIGVGSQMLNIFIEINKFCRRSKPHFIFGFQVAVALMTSSFPMFVPKLRHWYMDYKGAWVGFVCILCMEPSVGGTFWVFFLRAVGVVFGAFWGMVSYWAGVHQTNPYLETVITLFGAVPGFYYLLGTPYVKAAIIHIISIYVVMLASILPSAVPRDIVVNFAKRCLAVGYGGVIALIVQVLFYPVKARDQLTSEIAFVCGCISNMELLFSSSLEGEPITEALNESKYQKIVKLSSSAKAALERAKSYNGLTRQEPRLKGDFSELENIFSQIIFIQRQIVERIDTAALLRNQYGSAVIEELNYAVYPYRRQLLGNLTATMRSLQEAFLNKTPLPQFIPSTRISHRRVINKVRQIIELRDKQHKNSKLRKRKMDNLSPLDPLASDHEGLSESENEVIEGVTLRAPSRRASIVAEKFLVKEKFLTWSASSAAMEEIIEYIEELIYLTKLVVGVNEFKYGFLSRPLYEDWAAEAIRGFDDFVKGKTEGDATSRRSSTSTQDLTAISSGGSESSSGSSSTRSTRSSSHAAGDSSSHVSGRSPTTAIPTNFVVSDNEEEASIDSDRLLTNEADQPVQFNAAYIDENPNIEGKTSQIINRRESVNLARIASHKSDKKNPLPKTFRNRVYSIGSRNGLEINTSNDINRTRTLCDADLSLDEDDDAEDSSDDDIPLALKRIVSSMKSTHHRR